MQWEKLGVIWSPPGNMAWARKYATCPTPLWRKDGSLRLYIQCRDDLNVGRVGYVDVDPDNPLRIISVSEEPVLDRGVSGAFDDNGVFQTSVVRVPDGRIFMYYVGFELCHQIRYRLLTGLAISQDDGCSFERVANTPILERSSSELHIRCGPCVLPPEGNGNFRMWYVAGSEWEEIDGKSMPLYDLRYIESPDGIVWPREGQVIMNINHNNEHGFGRPWIVPSANGYRMFYSIRGRMPRAYYLGYAESKDGLQWARKDDLMNLDAAETGWDSESIEYSAVVSYNGQTYCFYNGNDFGVTGFGVARLVQ